MDSVDRAVACYKEGFNCSQAVLSVYGCQFGLGGETALKLACGFGGGMRMGQVCGAVTGAFMVIGLKYGQAEAVDKESKERTYRLVKEFGDKFSSRNGSVICKELLGCDISTREGMKTAREKDLFNSFCPKMVQDAAEILEDMLSV
jgi:C_GCAxxG_C_C family probable redox protein